MGWEGRGGGRGRGRGGRERKAGRTGVASPHTCGRCGDWSGVEPPAAGVAAVEGCSSWPWPEVPTWPWLGDSMCPGGVGWLGDFVTDSMCPGGAGPAIPYS